MKKIGGISVFANLFHVELLKGRQLDSHTVSGLNLLLSVCHVAFGKFHRTLEGQRAKGKHGLGISPTRYELWTPREVLGPRGSQTTPRTTGLAVTSYIATVTVTTAPMVTAQPVATN